MERYTLHFVCFVSTFLSAFAYPSACLASTGRPCKPVCATQAPAASRLHFLDPVRPDERRGRRPPHPQRSVPLSGGRGSCCPVHGAAARGSKMAAAGPRHREDRRPRRCGARHAWTPLETATTRLARWVRLMKLSCKTPQFCCVSEAREARRVFQPGRECCARL